MIKIKKEVLMVSIKMLARFVIMFGAFGVVGPALISANSYILVAAGFGWLIISVMVSIWLFGQVISYFIGDDDV